MIIRTIIRVWRWLHTKPVNRISDEWLRDHAVQVYDDNPKAQAKR